MRRWRAWRCVGEQERRWQGLGVEDWYGRREEREAWWAPPGEGEVDMGRRWPAWWRLGEWERGQGGSLWRLGERGRREWVVEARWRCGEFWRRRWVRRAGVKRLRRRLRDRASSLESDQSGGVGGTWEASRGAAWYWGGGEVPSPPWICHVGVRWQQRLVVRVE